MWIRKCFSLILVAIIISLCVPYQVFAAEIYDPWIDISEVCTVNDTGTNYFAFNGKTTVTLKPGFSTIVGQIDMIWFCGYGAPTNVYLWRNSNSASRLKLTIQNIGGSYYRIYGNVGNYTLSEYKFDIETGTTSDYRSYEIKSCRIAESLATYGVDYTFSVDPIVSTDVSYYTRGAEIHPYSSLGLPLTCTYIWQITPQNWNAYDYIDVHISTSSASIGSITVMHNGRSLPYDITNIYTQMDTVSYNDLGTSETPGQPSITAILHIDISSISRLSGVAPLITIQGNWNTSVGAYLEVYDIVGYIAPTERTGVAYWFEKAKDFLSDLIDPENGKEAAQDFQDEALQKGEQITDLNEQMDQVVKPPVNDIHLDMNGLVDASASARFTHIFKSMTNDTLLVSMMTITLTVALVAYILYGKR